MKNVVRLCDCMEFMKDLPDNAFDLAIVDPPYGIGIDGQKLSICKKATNNRKHHAFKGWDIRPPSDYFTELIRISVNQIIWGGNYFADILPIRKGWIMWDKGQYGLTMSDGELAYSSFFTPLRIIKINRGALSQEGTIHPTQKPIALYKWLLQNYAKPGQTIFDSHVGSGSIRIACYDFGFSFEGCEIDEDYHAAQDARFRQHISQGRLFEPEEIQQPEQIGLKMEES